MVFAIHWHESAMELHVFTEWLSWSISQPVLSLSLQHLNEIRSVIPTYENSGKRALSQEYINSKRQGWNSHSSGSEIMLFVLYRAAMGHGNFPNPQVFNSTTLNVRVQTTSQPLILPQLGNEGIKTVSQGFPWLSSGTLLSNAGGVSSTTDLGAKIPHASGPKNQNMKQKQCYNKFNQE